MEGRKVCVCVCVVCVCMACGCECGVCGCGCWYAHVSGNWLYFNAQTHVELTLYPQVQQIQEL